jgi:hypothetical protein
VIDWVDGRAVLVWCCSVAGPPLAEQARPAATGRKKGSLAVQEHVCSNEEEKGQEAHVLPKAGGRQDGGQSYVVVMLHGSRLVKESVLYSQCCNTHAMVTMRACACCSVIMGFDVDFDQCLWKKCEGSSIFDQDI